MKLKGIEFGPILGGAGVQGFFGEGQPIHQYIKHVPGFNFNGLTFVAKTTTMRRKDGNMEIDPETLMSKKFLPDCIKVYLRKGIILNAVGLSGPGAPVLFSKGFWQEREEPFFLSFSSAEDTSEKRLKELKLFIEDFGRHKRDFKADVGLQLNYACPEVKINQSSLVSEVKESLKIASVLNIPLMPKFNVEIPIDVAKEISEHSACDALCVSNTIPWGHLPDDIDWQDLFGTDISPLKKYSGGGLSGRPLFPLVVGWVRRARKAGIKIPINAGGGILYPDDVNCLKAAGASSVFISSVAVLRPLNMQKIIKRAHKIFV